MKAPVIYPSDWPDTVADLNPGDTFYLFPFEEDDSRAPGAPSPEHAHRGEAFMRLSPAINCVVLTGSHQQLGHRFVARLDDGSVHAFPSDTRIRIVGLKAEAADENW